MHRYLVEEKLTMTTFVYIAASLDGFIATLGGGLDWLEEIPNPEQSDYGYAEFMCGIDAIVMGRRTYEKVLTFDAWPYEKPVFVLSSTLSAAPDELAGKVEFIHGSPQQVIQGLEARGCHNLYIDGGQTIQGFLAADQIDELILTHIPVLLGQGISLFGELAAPLKFTHRKTELYGPLVKSHYIRERG
jgi:dihydrofolate reductase